MEVGKKDAQLGTGACGRRKGYVEDLQGEVTLGSTHGRAASKPSDSSSAAQPARV